MLARCWHIWKEVVSSILRWIALIWGVRQWIELVSQYWLLKIEGHINSCFQLISWWSFPNCTMVLKITAILNIFSELPRVAGMTICLGCSHNGVICSISCAGGTQDWRKRYGHVGLTCWSCWLKGWISISKKSSGSNRLIGWLLLRSLAFHGKSLIGSMVGNCCRSCVKASHSPMACLCLSCRQTQMS